MTLEIVTRESLRLLRKLRPDLKHRAIAEKSDKICHPMVDLPWLREELSWELEKFSELRLAPMVERLAAFIPAHGATVSCLIPPYKHTPSTREELFGLTLRGTIYSPVEDCYVLRLDTMVI